MEYKLLQKERGRQYREAWESGNRGEERGGEREGDREGKRGGEREGREGERGEREGERGGEGRMKVRKRERESLSERDSRSGAQVNHEDGNDNDPEAQTKSSFPSLSSE